MQEPWITKNNVTHQRIAIFLILAVGLFLITTLLKIESPWTTNETAGFYLGVLLAGIGFYGLFFSGETTTIVDPRLKIIKITDKSPIKEKVAIIRFGEIDHFSIGHIGNNEGGNRRYHVVAKLKSGKQFGLFVGFYEGSLDRGAMELRRERLTRLLESSKQQSNE